MQKKESLYITGVNFEEQTPKMQIGMTKTDILYEKAFLSREDLCKSKYTRNTTTWD